MPNTKVYKIQINGVQESVSELDALIAKAEELSRKLAQGMTVDVQPQVQQPQQANTSQAAEKTFTVQAQITTEIEKQNAALQQQTSIVSSQSSSYKDALDVATSILGTYDDNIAKLAEYDSKLKEIASQKKAVQDIGVENEQTRAIMQELLADEIKYKQLKSETASILKTETKLLQAEEGSYDQMSAAVGRLRDALRASNGNLSPEQFSAISSAVSELDKQLKDADKGMGNFFRNVGNYPSAAEGFNKIKVEIAGTTQEFDGAKTAIMSLKNAMAQLAVEGKTDTEEYKNLADQMRDLQLAMVTVNDEIERSKDASSGLHDTIEMVQGFAAIGEIGQGFSQLFGMDDSAITEQIQKMTTLMGILQGLNELKNQIATGTGIGPVLKKVFDVTGLSSSMKELGENVKLLAQKLGLVPPAAEAGAVGMTTFAVATRVATSAVKAFWRALVVGLIIEAVVWLIEGLVDGIKALYNIIHDYISVADDAEAANKALAHSYELVTQQIDNYNEVRDHEVARGEITKEIADMEKMLNIQQQLAKYAGVTEGAFMLNAENADITPVLHQYDEFEQRLQSINEKNEQGLKIGSDMDALYKDVLADLSARWLEVDKNDQKAIEGFMEWYKQAPLYQSAVKWAIDTGDDSMKQFASTINDAFNNLGSLINRFYSLKAAADSAIASANATVDYYVNYVAKYGKNASAAQSRDKKLEEIDKSNRSEEKKAEARKRVEQEYAESTKAHKAGGQKVARTIKSNNHDILNLERQLQQDRLALMRDGLSKTLATIEEERRRRLDAVNKMAVSEAKKAEAIAAINARYNQQAEDAQKEHNEKILKENKEFAERLQKMQEEVDKMDFEHGQKKRELDLSDQIMSLNKDTAKYILQPYYDMLEALGKETEAVETRISTLRNSIKTKESRLASNNEQLGMKGLAEAEKDALKTDNFFLQQQIGEQQKLLDMYLEAQGRLEEARETLMDWIRKDPPVYAEPDKLFVAFNDYIYDRFNLTQDYRKKELEAQKAFNKLTMDNELKALNDELEEQQKALEKRYEARLEDSKQMTQAKRDEYAAMVASGNATQEQLEEQLETINWYESAELAVQMQYEEKRLDLQLAYDDKMSEVIEANRVENTRLNREYTTETQKLYAEMYSNISNELNKFLSSVDKAQGKLKTSNTDTWGFFNIRKFREDKQTILKDYNSIIETAERKIEELREKIANENLDPFDFFDDFQEFNNIIDNAKEKIHELNADNGLEDFMKGVDEWLQNLGQAANQILSAVFDYRNSEFDRMQEELDKQIELVQEKYDEMEELAQKHKDAMNEIEDELTTARGDRRQHLIDALSTEIDAQRHALAEQKKAEKEKKKLEADADKLELQRKKEQQRQSLITAIINAAMAISQAAANHWPVPAIPLMAVAAAVGAAQVAAISSQKYAEGGLLNGPSHERGGIKVGGGIEVEGGEFVTNKRTTSKNLDLLYFINSSKKRLDINDLMDFYSSGGNRKPLMGTKGKFADGGLTPSLEVASRVAEVVIQRDETPIVVSVVDINNAQARVRQVQALAGLSNG